MGLHAVAQGQPGQTERGSEAHCGCVSRLREAQTPVSIMCRRETGDLDFHLKYSDFLSGTGSHDTGVTGTMTVVTTVMRGAVCTLPAADPLRVRTDSALIRPMSVMGTMTVEITLMSWSTSVTPQRPHVPLISSGVTMGTALRW